LLIYSYIASVLPVWLLLQPRDYINALQLISALGLVVVGLVVAGVAGGAPLPDGTRPELALAAPMVNFNPVGAPAMIPFLFITIACGAISGFHCLVSSGTSSKQLKSEPEARFVGYGSMLLEAFLAVLVILACAAGLGLGIAQTDGSVLVGNDAYLARYSVWSSRLGPLVAAFVDGSSNFLKAIGMPAASATAVMGVFVASFAGTTLDSACRLQRYVIQEIAATGFGREGNRARAFAWLRNKHGATLAAVALAAFIAAIPPPGQAWAFANAGQGGLILWPLFGATNQLLGGLSFLVITFYLWRRGIPVWFIALPMIFMLIMPMWAMFWQVFVGDGGNPSWLSQRNWLLVSIAIATMALEVWMIVEAWRLFPRAKGIIEENAVQPVQAIIQLPRVSLAHEHRSTRSRS
jgi:carbon starvation protein